MPHFSATLTSRDLIPLLTIHGGKDIDINPLAWEGACVLLVMHHALPGWPIRFLIHDVGKL